MTHENGSGDKEAVLDKMRRDLLSHLEEMMETMAPMVKKREVKWQLAERVLGHMHEEALYVLPILFKMRDD
jgi:hypothetical protein